jgi:hypothetical protein
MATHMMPRPARWAGVEVTDLDPRPVVESGRTPNPRTVSVGPMSPFANPFDSDSADPLQRLGALTEYAVWVAGRGDLLAAAAQDLAGRDLSCTHALNDPACHRTVLLDIANPPAAPLRAGGGAMALTLRRPWASLLLVPGALGGKMIENRTWATDYRGICLIYAGTRVDQAGMAAAERAGLDAPWHGDQSGWLGAAVLVNVHPARGHCCRPWGEPQRRRDQPIYHWVFAHPHRLAARTWGRGFLGLQPMSWSVLVRRSALRAASPPAYTPAFSAAGGGHDDS